jgi:ELWxxDGT repeat protein
VGVGGKAYVGSSDGLQAFSGPDGSQLFGGSVSALTVVGDRLLFPGGGGGSSWPLYASDGTAAGTQAIATLPEDGPCNIEGNPPFCRGPSGFANVCGTAYFYGADPTDGSAPYGATDLWRSDGTSAGTARVKGIPGTTHGRSAIVEMGRVAYFTIDDTSGNRVLWSSDGTDAGTVPIATVNAGGSNPPPADLTVVGQTLFFVAGDGAGGIGLWRSDGTADGTSLVAAGVDPTDLTASGGALYFAGTDPTNGTELWRSDGTPGGTQLVKDINQGAGSSNPSSITDVGGTVYFAADDGVHGRELWSSDGTPGGTNLIGDINPGSAGSDPANLTVDGSNLYFAADDGVNGAELWKDQLAQAPSPPASDCPPPPPGTSTPPPTGTSTPLPAASGSGPSTSPSAPRPTLRHAHLRRRSFSARAGTSLTITLSGPMTLTISVGQQMPGRMIGDRCSTRVRRGHRCTLWRTRAHRRLRGRAGRNVLRFQFRGLAPGHYTAMLVGSSHAGHTSTVRLSFTITKSR